MKKRKLKPAVKVSFIVTGVLVFVIGLAISFGSTKPVSNSYEDFIYVNDYIFDNYYPVIKNEEKLIRPYNSNKVTLYKNFYDKDDAKEQQQNSIIYYDNIYMQNSGVDYLSEEPFEVLSSLSGTVTNITEDTLLGKTIEIRHSTEIILTYQSLGEILVKQGDVISQGDIIAKSGTSAINNDKQNTLHVEIYVNGTVINPEKYFDKPIKELTNN